MTASGGKAVVQLGSRSASRHLTPDYVPRGAPLQSPIRSWRWTRRRYQRKQLGRI